MDVACALAAAEGVLICSGFGGGGGGALGGTDVCTEHARVPIVIAFVVPVSSGLCSCCVAGCCYIKCLKPQKPTSGESFKWPSR